MTRSPRVCIVVGVGPGIGLATAKRFAREGFAVAMLARRADALKNYVEEVTRSGGVAKAYACDLVDPIAAFAAVENAIAELGVPSVLVYNAAFWRESHPMDLSPQVFADDLNVSVVSALASVQAVYRPMKVAGGGTILFTGGGLALKPETGVAVPSLTAGKSALRGLAYALNPTLAEDHIKVAILTVKGMIKFDTDLNANIVAERFWSMYGVDAANLGVETFLP